MTKKVVDLHVVGDDKQTPYLGEDDLALRFSERHTAGLRYVAAWGKWFQWDGTRWTVDRTVNVYNLARTICREAAAKCKKPGLARMITRASTTAAIERLARSDRRHAATVEEWDRDPWFLNTPGGTIDLRTGDIKPNDPEDMITKVTTVAPRMGCQKWTEFLKRITDGDEDLQVFLQRMAGYGLTGLTREHALFFLFGIGANGKSVFLNTLAGLAGDYHVTAPMEVFIASNSDRHPTELAMLRGARLVTAVETEEGRRWAESRIKSLTGGDPIAARFMRQDFFEFTPVFKLMIAGNHKPQLRNVDEAIRRRLHLIPFTVTIPKSERDQSLQEKLTEEWPGILEWAIEGAVEWGMTGLQPPEAVRSATDEYLVGEDAFALWLDECCERRDGSHETTADLYESWRGWNEKAGERQRTRKAFSQAVKAHGFEPKRQAGTGRAGYIGIELKRVNYAENHWSDQRSG